MALLKSFVDNYIGGYEQHLPLELFAQVERRIKEKKIHIMDAQNECDLLEQQAVNLYKSNVQYLRLPYSMIEKTQNWMHMLKNNKDMDGNKLDKRKKYEEKQSYDYILRKLQEFLGIEDIVIDKIYNYNYGQGWEIVFCYKDTKWELTIPNLPRITVEDYRREGVRCFALRLLYFEKDYVTSEIGYTFIEEDLARIMQEGLAKIKQNNLVLAC